MMMTVTLNSITVELYAFLLIAYVSLFANGGLALEEDRHLISPKFLRKAINPPRSAITILSTNVQSDVIDLCHVLHSLVHLPKIKEGYPVLVFNEGNLSEKQMRDIDKCATPRKVAYPVVNLNGNFPLGFDSEKEFEDFSSKLSFRPVDGREKWSYAQMIRFWTVGIWQHPAIQEFDTIMRIDTDSCFFEDVKINPAYETLPELDEKYIYQSNEGEHGLPTYVQGLFEYAQEYVKKENITPTYPELWDIAETLWLAKKNSPLFRSNFEVCRVSFFQREDVMKWHKSLSETEPFGVWRGRWGDAQTRFLTMAMFGSKESVLMSPPTGYVHGKGVCASLHRKEEHD